MSVANRVAEERGEIIGGRSRVVSKYIEFMALGPSSDGPSSGGLSYGGPSNGGPSTVGPSNGRPSNSFADLLTGFYIR